MRIRDWSSDVCSSDLGRDEAERDGILEVVHAISDVICKIHDRAVERFGFVGENPDAVGLGQRLVNPIDDVPLTLHVAFRRLSSEEHTSELQSLMRISYALFCLNKKKTTQKCYARIKQQHT